MGDSLEIVLVLMRVPLGIASGAGARRDEDDRKAWA
jgi:hypothetical protein